MKLFHSEFIKWMEDYLTEILITACGYNILLLRLSFWMYERCCFMFTLKKFS